MLATKPINALTAQALDGIVILCDTRERSPLPVTRFPMKTETLSVGDYGIRGFSHWDNPAFIVERKSLGDLISSLTQNRERFFRELLKLRQFEFRAVLIETEESEVRSEAYRSRATPQSILTSVAAIRTRLGVQVIWASNPHGAAETLEELAYQFVKGRAREFQRLMKATA